MTEMVKIMGKIMMNHGSFGLGFPWAETRHFHEAKMDHSLPRSRGTWVQLDTALGSAKIQEAVCAGMSILVTEGFGDAAYY